MLAGKEGCAGTGLPGSSLLLRAGGAERQGSGREGIGASQAGRGARGRQQTKDTEARSQNNTGGRPKGKHAAGSVVQGGQPQRPPLRDPQYQHSSTSAGRPLEGAVGQSLEESSLSGSDECRSRSEGGLKAQRDRL